MLRYLPDRYRFAWTYHLRVAAVALVFLIAYWFGIIVPVYATHPFDSAVTLLLVVFIFYLNFWVVWPWVAKEDRLRRGRIWLVACINTPLIIGLSLTIAMTFGDLEADFEGATVADFLTLFDGSIPNFYAYMLPQFAALALGYVAFSIEWTYGPFANRKTWLKELRDARIAWRRAQLDPHLLDRLLVVLSVITRRSKTDAQQALDLVIEVVHFHVGGNDPGKRILLDEEIGAVRSLFELQRIRYGEALNWELRVGDGLTGVEIMPIILMVYAENQLHRAVVDSANHPAVLEIARAGNDLVVSGRNRIKDMPEKPGSGTGLANLRERLAFDYEGRFAMVSDIANGWYVFSLVIYGIFP